MAVRVIFCAFLALGYPLVKLIYWAFDEPLTLRGVVADVLRG